MERILKYTILVLSIMILFSGCKKKEEETDPPPPVENTPVALEASQIYMSNFLAHWQMVADVDGYEIELATDAGFSNLVQTYQYNKVGNSDKTYVYGLEGDTKYYYRVRAFRTDGFSYTYGGYSNAIEVITNNTDQLPNMDFEVWDQMVNYENPSPYGIWATPNKTVDLNPAVYPVLVEKTTDAVSGEYAVKMSTDQIFIITEMLLTGSLTTGLFEVNLSNPTKSLKKGIPFTSKPTAFRGYYKYLPVDGDSCALYATLSKWNNVSKEQEVIAHAGLNTTEYPQNYAEFILDFDYKTEGVDPDTLTIVFASSAGGEEFVGSVGSTLFVDDISLVYDNK